MLEFFENLFCGNLKNKNEMLSEEYANLFEGYKLLQKELIDKKSLLNSCETSLININNENQTLQLKLVNSLKYSFVNDLPSCFESTDKNYSGNCPVISKLEEKDFWYKKSSDSLELSTFWDSYLDACKIKESDSALQVFNKILNTTQRLVKYTGDFKQWGKGESWVRPSIEWITKKADCDGASQIVVSVFEYYQLKHGRFNAFAFVGTGNFNRTYAHAFPCILIEQTEISGTIKDFLMENLFIGEATLDAEIPARELKLVQGSYDLRLGGLSFWHNFGLKDELRWW